MCIMIFPKVVSRRRFFANARFSLRSILEDPWTWMLGFGRAWTSMCSALTLLVAELMHVGKIQTDL